jgi:glycosyltransferase involved in cell wall biosynthesis
MSRPRISVVIAVKNVERYLGEALRSVVDQSYPSTETIVVDGNSSDRSVDVANSFSGVRCISQVGSGLAGAWNQGIEASHGELIAFLDGDDRWLPDKLEAQVDLLRENPDAAGAIGLVRFFLQADAAAPPGLRPELLEGERVGPMPGTLLVRREVFDRIGTFDPSLTVALDVDWFARAKDAGFEFVTVQRPVLEKRFHEGNLSHMHPAGYQREMLRTLRSSVARQRAQSTRPAER